MNRIKLNIESLVYSQTQSGAYVLVLIEENGERKLPIVIGTAEAQAIAIALEGMKPPRPLTHDLFINFVERILPDRHLGKFYQIKIERLLTLLSGQPHFLCVKKEGVLLGLQMIRKCV